MAGVHLLDRFIGSEYPSFATEDDVRAFEQIPYGDRIAAESTYDALKLAASRYPDAPAIQFLANADPADRHRTGIMTSDFLRLPRNHQPFAGIIIIRPAAVPRRNC